MENRDDWNPKSKLILAIVLIAAGILLLARNSGLLSYNLYSVIFSLPMLLIVIGLVTVTKKPNKTFGLVLIALGGFFLLPKFIPGWSVQFHQLFWPAVFLGIGLLILFKGGNTCSKPWKKKEELNSSEIIDEVNVFGGTERRITTKNFRGGETVSVFGGTVLDFTDSDLAEGKNVLEVVNIFGGSKLIIPSHWNVHLEVVSIFGGFSDKRKVVGGLPQDHTKELYIKGVAIFGGGEIKSF